MIWLAIDTVWRLFFIQGSRNVRTIDGLGFFFVMEPLIRRLAGGGQDMAGAASRYAVHSGRHDEDGARRRRERRAGRA
jgi:mannose/fructose/N-acetylgalactosamine-specific phosphotransferase system component IID